MRKTSLLGRLLIVLAVLLGGGAVGSGIADAHSRVVSINPPDGAALAQGPAAVEITYNEPLQSQFASASVVGPDQHFWHAGDPVVDGKVLRIPLRPLGPAGVYRVNFRVTSADGHPVSGQRTFRLTAAGTGTPGAAATDPAGGMPVWPWLVGAGVLLLLAAVAVARVTRNGSSGAARRR
ncbi:MAG: copper resistance protein CopC [Gordonia sp. (in: high G+C Gram-positive bacteria)]|uniref:copper resistance CopC family protein n=1 Tax=Gordonia sp. (in: high G+C Gram-positive bacteria) TaxID=84139 RepID=UPI0039E2C3AD